MEHAGDIYSEEARLALGSIYYEHKLEQRKSGEGEEVPEGKGWCLFLHGCAASGAKREGAKRLSQHDKDKRGLRGSLLP